MSVLSRLRKWLQTPYTDPVAIPARVQFAPDELLIARLERARAALPENSIPRLIEPQPDEFLRFGHLPEEPL